MPGEILPKNQSKRNRRRARAKRAARVSRRVVIWSLLAGVTFAHVTNPFTRPTIVRDPYTVTKDEHGDIELKQQGKLKLLNQRVIQDLGWIKSGIHIFNNVYGFRRTVTHASSETVINTIHSLRFDPKRPFLISGDHFSVLYPRSLGIFYADTLDPRTARSKEDWENRQAIYLKTLAYALDTYEQSKELSTTIVPMGPSTVTMVNFFAPPSDTLYSLLYALRTLSTSDDFLSTYPIDETPSYSLATKKAAEKLLAIHHDSLVRHVQTYEKEVFDPTANLIRKDIFLSSTKDSNKRTSSFYDNVIYWKTRALAQELGLEEKDPAWLASYKQHILDTYWLEKEGYFLEDLSPRGIAEKHYSSDWLITLMTGFLRPDNPKERPYFTRSIAYIQGEKLDQPFPLKYQPANRKQDMFFFVRTFAPSYSGEAIWSNWGTEYIKALCLLSKQTGQRDYFTSAQSALTAYEENIKKYQGFPELYTASGTLFTNLFYKSVLQTGWVVSYEEAKVLCDHSEPHNLALH